MALIRPLPVPLIAGLLALAALAPMPYGYYIGLRWFFFLASACYFFIGSLWLDEAYDHFVAAFLAVTYNPFLPLHLEAFLPEDIASKPVWAVINFGAALCFVDLNRKLLRRQHPERPPDPQ